MDGFRPRLMKKMLQRNSHSGRNREPFALLLIAALFLAAVGITSEAAESRVKSKSEGKGFFGISMQELTDDIIEGLDLKVKRGVLVNDVIDDSPAEDVGIRKGDIITEYDGKKVEGPDEFARLVRKTPVGKTVEVKVIRDEDTKTFKVTIGERPEDLTFDFDVDLPHVLRLGGRPGMWGYFYPSSCLGVRVSDLSDDLASYFDVESGEGVLVLEVEDDSEAGEMGVKAGDIITELEGEDVGSVSDLKEAVLELEPEEEFELSIVRHGKEMRLKGTMQKGPRMHIFGESYYPKKGHRDLFLWSEDAAEGLKDATREALRKSRSSWLEEREDLREELRKLKEELKELREKLEELRED